MAVMISLIGSVNGWARPGKYAPSWRISALANAMCEPQHAPFTNKNGRRMKYIKLFAGLKKMRDFERSQLPFIKSLIDFDIIIEIGYAQEQKRAFTPKQLSKVGSVTTVRRRLVKLTEQGVVARSTNAKDHRSELLTLTASSLKILEKYGRMLSGIGQLTKDIAAVAQ
jgi:DNA-binding MarR family transcriptional regulator